MNPRKPQKAGAHALHYVAAIGIIGLLIIIGIAAVALFSRAPWLFLLAWVALPVLGKRFQQPHTAQRLSLRAF